MDHRPLAGKPARPDEQFIFGFPAQAPEPGPRPESPRTTARQRLNRGLESRQPCPLAISQGYYYAPEPNQELFSRPLGAPRNSSPLSTALSKSKDTPSPPQHQLSRASEGVPVAVVDKLMDSMRRKAAENKPGSASPTSDRFRRPKANTVSGPLRFHSIERPSSALGFEETRFSMEMIAPIASPELFSRPHTPTTSSLPHLTTNRTHTIKKVHELEYVPVEIAAPQIHDTTSAPAYSRAERLRAYNSEQRKWAKNNLKVTPTSQFEPKPPSKPKQPARPTSQEREAEMYAKMLAEFRKKEQDSIRAIKQKRIKTNKIKLKVSSDDDSDSEKKTGRRNKKDSSDDGSDDEEEEEEIDIHDLKESLRAFKAEQMRLKAIEEQEAMLRHQARIKAQQRETEMKKLQFERQAKLQEQQAKLKEEQLLQQQEQQQPQATPETGIEDNQHTSPSEKQSRESQIHPEQLPHHRSPTRHDDYDEHASSPRASTQSPTHHIGRQSPLSTRGSHYVPQIENNSNRSSAFNSRSHSQIIFENDLNLAEFTKRFAVMPPSISISPCRSLSPSRAGSDANLFSLTRQSHVNSSRSPRDSATHNL